MTANLDVTTGQPSSFVKNRIAVAAMFFLNGMMVGAWAPAIPAFKDKHGLAESDLGLMILMIGVGSLVTMPLTGAMISRHGSTIVLRIAASICTVLLPLALFAPTVGTAIAALLVFGGGLGAMDVSMNANAVRVEERYSRPIMSSSHGFWSLGALVGAGAGGLLLSQFGLYGQATSIAITMVVGVALAIPALMADTVHHVEGAPRAKLTLPRSATLWLIALTTLAGFAAEGAILDWAALYLRNEHAVPSGMAGYAFAAFSAMMAFVRFVGDPIRTKLGDVRTMQISAALGTVGFLIAGLSPSLPGVIVGFAIVGLGLANVVPIGFAAADRVPGVPRGIGISVATFCGYAGLLVAPPLIGFAAEVSTFAIIFTCVAVLPLYCLIVARSVGRP